MHCNGKQWGKAAVGAAVDAALIVAGGPALKLVGTIAEKTVGKLAFRAAEKVFASCMCLVAGTEVATPTGLVAIQDIKVGDLVLAYNQTTGQVAAKPVTALIRPEPQATFEVKLVDADHTTESFRASADHPWLLTNGQWEHTQDLKAGEHIRTATGSDLIVTFVKVTGNIEQTYNLT